LSGILFSFFLFVSFASQDQKKKQKIIGEQTAMSDEESKPTGFPFSHIFLPLLSSSFSFHIFYKRQNKTNEEEEEKKKKKTKHTILIASELAASTLARTPLCVTQRTTMPWKNGGGITHELFRQPSAPADFDVRISIAEVASNGPFSRFPGVDRIIALVHGNGFRFFNEKAEHVLDRRCQPVSFRGDEAWDCTLLAGPVRDFNVMVRRESGLEAHVFPMKNGVLPKPCFVLAVDEGAQVNRGWGPEVLPREELAVFEEKTGDVLLNSPTEVLVVQCIQRGQN
jgi:hypothetical protein